MCTLAQKNNTFTFYKGGVGAIAHRSQKNVKNGGLTFFYIKHYIPDAKIYSVMMWIQIHAKGGGGGGPEIILSKWRNLVHSECSQIRYYQPKINNFKAFFPQY